MRAKGQTVRGHVILRAGDIEELRKGVNFEAPKTNEKAADEEDYPVKKLESKTGPEL